MIRPLGQSFKFPCRFLFATAVLFSAPSLWAGDDEAAQVQEGQAAEEGQAIEATIRFVDGDKAKEDSGYWIGLMFGTISDEHREKIKLEKGYGVIVSEVFPKSPAAQAGLKADDIIVAIGKKPLTSLEQLVEAVAVTKDGVLRLNVVRQGEHQIIEVRPAKRPAAADALVFGEDDEKSKEVIKRLRRQLEELQKAEQSQRDQAKAQALKRLEAAQAQEVEARRRAERAQAEAQRQALTQAARAEAEKKAKGETHKIEGKEPGGIIFRLEGAKGDKEVGRQVEQFKFEGGKGIIILSEPKQPGAAPGTPVPAPPGEAGPRLKLTAPGTPMQAWGGSVANPQALPDDMKVSISKQGKQPAQIVVEQGAKLWKTTENEMEMLPAAARAYAAQILGRLGPMTFNFGGGGSGPMPGASGAGGLGIIGHGQQGPPHGHTFELKLDPKGQVIGIENRHPEGAKGKQPEGGGLQFKLQLEGEKGADNRKPGEKPHAGWLELKFAEPPPAANKSAEVETRELTEKLQQLRKQLEDLRKAAEEKKK